VVCDVGAGRHGGGDDKEQDGDDQQNLGHAGPSSPPASSLRAISDEYSANVSLAGRPGDRFEPVGLQHTDPGDTWAEFWTK
jgi:hypothetical protein